MYWSTIFLFYCSEHNKEPCQAQMSRCKLLRSRSPCALAQFHQVLCLSNHSTTCPVYWLFLKSGHGRPPWHITDGVPILISFVRISSKNVFTLCGLIIGYIYTTFILIILPNSPSKQCRPRSDAALRRLIRVYTVCHLFAIVSTHKQALNWTY